VAGIGQQLLTAALAAGHFEVLWAGGAALVCLIVVLVAGGMQGAGAGGRRTRRAGRRAGLSRNEARVLHHLTRAGQLRQDAELLRNRPLLDGVLQRGVAALRYDDAPDRSRYRHRLAVLLSIKARVDAAVPAAIRSLAPFQEGERITLARAAMDGIETTLLAGIGDVLACSLPADPAAPAPLRAGMQVTVRPAGSGQRQAGVTATVLGRDWVAGQSALLLTCRTTQTAANPSRTGRRRCEVTPLAVQFPLAAPVPSGARPGEETARREPSVIGTLVSLDAKWAGVRAVAPVAAGRLVKMVVELGRAARLPLYGKVVQAPRRGKAGVMLVHLTGLSRSRISDLYRFVDECWSAAGAAPRR
jgi:hypothetical protein